MWHAVLPSGGQQETLHLSNSAAQIEQSPHPDKMSFALSQTVIYRNKYRLEPTWISNQIFLNSVYENLVSPINLKISSLIQTLFKNVATQKLAQLFQMGSQFPVNWKRVFEKAWLKKAYGAYYCIFAK